MGVAGWAACHPVLLRFGYGPETTAALLLALGSAVAGGLLLGRRTAQTAKTGTGSVPTLLAAAALVALPWTLKLATAAVTAGGLEPLTHAPLRFLLVTLGCLLALGLPACAAGMAAARQIAAGYGATLLAGTACGIAAAALVVGPGVGLHMALLVTAMLTAAVWFVRAFTGALPEADQNTHRHHTTDLAGSERFPRWAVARQFLVAGAVAVAVTATVRVLHQLMPAAAYLHAIAAATLLAGLAGGAVLARRSGEGATGRRCGALLLAAGALLPIAAFGLLVRGNLEANAQLSNIFWLMTLRAGLTIACLLPVAIGAGLLCGRPVLSQPHRLAGLLFGFAAVFCAAHLLLPVAGPALLAACAAVAAISLGFTPLRREWPAAWRSRVGLAGGAAAVVALTAGMGHYNPVASARLLFNTNVFVARSNGTPAALLPHLDDARPIASVGTAAGAATLWKQHGDLFHLRIDGLPAGMASRRPDRCPGSPVEVLRVALPLVLHPAAEHLLILGDASGTGTATATGFPLRSIAVCDADPAARNLLAAHAQSAAGSKSDDRVQTYGIAPRLALAAQDRRFDAIVSDPGMPSLPAAQACLTREFYALAASRLSEQGVFCQRLRYSDFGPEPLAVLAASMRPAFGEIAAVSVGTGEFLLLGSAPGRPLVGDGLFVRLQRPQVRKTLAGLGWDWCVPLNLIVLDQTTLTTLIANVSPQTHTDANGRFAYTLPQEVMRWAPKWQELQTAVGDRASRFLERGVPAGDQPDVLDRLAEVTGRHALMARYPDQPWSYRKEVKKKLQEHPRSVIQPVSGTLKRTQHPDDRRRLRYFEVLGEALQNPTAQTLASVEESASTYDPLLDWFMQNEVAGLWESLGTAGAAAALQHRLYIVQHADARDRSVRDVIDTINLITAQPTLIADSADRFDQLNGLLQTLMVRWQLRGTAAPHSPEVVLIDIDKSLHATTAALTAMTPLAPAVGFTDETWNHRRAAVERQLVRPLKTYRSGLVAHLQSKEGMVAAIKRNAAKKAEAETPTPAKSASKPRLLPTGL